MSTVVLEQTIPSELLLNKLLKIPMMFFFANSTSLSCFSVFFQCHRSTIELADTDKMQAVYEEVGETRYTYLVKINMSSIA